MDSTDIKICREIGQLLYDTAPDGAVRIVMRAELSPEGDHCRFEFDYVDRAGSGHWFTGGGQVNKKLIELLVQHRAFFVSQHQPPWMSCEYAADVGSSKFTMQLSYEQVAR